MHLRSLTLKGFKSFPDRTRLDFGPGVSVVVGPNGSGKSNVTDAVLWAMGEQSPLAVRGASMQDVIFGGGRGVQARSAAEVEIVLDNSDGAVQVPFTEISIVRRLDRSGEGEYRLNGARCRLADVLEALSDTGLGKESHSVISQGRVESIVMSKPRERRLLIEEAAGLGKHRRRRRRAQLKLVKTEENLDRALDVEREARSRLRPLKRQAEAAELHERLERQSLEIRLRLAVEAARLRRQELGQAESQVRGAREAQAEIQARLEAVTRRRAQAEQALAQRASQRDALSRRVYGARSAHERLQMRAEQVTKTSEAIAARIEQTTGELQALEALVEQEREQHEDADRLQGLEDALSALLAEQEQALQRELAELAQQCEQAAARTAELTQQAQQARQARGEADAGAERAREAMRERERAAQEARRASAQVGAELAAANQFLRSHSHPLARRGATGGADGSAIQALGELLGVEQGCELAVAAALGGRLEAALVEDMAGAKKLLDSAGPDGGSVLIAGGAEGDEAGGAGGDAAAGEPPAPGARALAELLSGPDATVALARRLLAGAWLVESLDDLPETFAGVAVTRAGRVWFSQLCEVRQIAEGGADRVLAMRNERDRLIAATEQTAQAEQTAQGAVEVALQAVREADGRREQGERLLREAERALGEAREEERRAKWVMDRRRSSPQEGPLAVRRAQLEGELAAERRQAQRMQRERQERARRTQMLAAQRGADEELAPGAQRLASAIESAQVAVAARVKELEALLAQDSQAGEQMAAELRSCAGEEAEIQAALRREGEAVTAAEVAAQRLRDAVAEIDVELAAVGEGLQIEQPSPESEEPLEEQEAQELQGRLQRLARRREQLGPVNPLAQEEYAEALAHVEELETRRADLETALRELRTLIRDTDRQIQETFQQTFSTAARNFEELAKEVFPGGSGRLRLVSEEPAQKAVIGGQPSQDAAEAEGAADAEAAQEAREQGDEDEQETGEQDALQGVEIEITPAGKSAKRLSLLSGGEKSMTALAFLFAVFLAKPCPFYILDEVEAALDDLNLDRFLALLRRHRDQAQFIVITHQKRTMEAADWLYGVSMGGDGVSKVISRRLPPEAQEAQGADGAEGAGAPKLEAA
jgi:chromosome segregation protein